MEHEITKRMNPFNDVPDKQALDDLIKRLFTDDENTEVDRDFYGPDIHNVVLGWNAATDHARSNIANWRTRAGAWQDSAGNWVSGRDVLHAGSTGFCLEARDIAPSEQQYYVLICAAEDRGEKYPMTQTFWTREQ
jgi:hypothetical protein